MVVTCSTLISPQHHHIVRAVVAGVVDEVAHVVLLHQSVDIVHQVASPYVLLIVP